MLDFAQFILFSSVNLMSWSLTYKYVNKEPDPLFSNPLPWAWCFGIAAILTWGI